VLWLLPLVFMALFFYAPLAAVFGRMAQGFSAAGLGRTDAAGYLLRVLGFTLWQALLSTVLTLALGLPAAWIFARLRFPGKHALHILITLPFILPTVVAASAFSALLGPGGWANQLLMALFGLSQPPIQFMNTLGAILAAHVFYNVAIIIRVVGAAWSQLDPRLEHAARALGASPARTLREVTLPLLRPAILSAALLVFLFDFASFGVVLILGGPQFATLEVEVYTQALHMLNLPLAALLSALQLACTLVLTVLYQRVQGTRRVPLLPRFSDELAHAPRTRAERLLLWGVLAVLVLLILLPLLALVLKSVLLVPRGGGPASFTLEFYRELFINRRDSLFHIPPVAAIRNSLVYGLLTVLFSLGLGTLIAYALERPGRLGAVLETAVMLPLGLSPVTLGLGFILLFNAPPLDARSFPLLVPIAHSLVALPMVVRTLQPALRAIPAHLRDSAAVLGASPLRRWLEVDLPILARAGAAAGVFAFTISLGEFGATSFLSRPESPTLPTAIFRFLSQPGSLNYGASMAMSVLLLLICAAAIVVIESILRRSANAAQR
jgi:thiamine transport system permease protein